jgi:predicted transcriptional regulator
MPGRPALHKLAERIADAAAAVGASPDEYVCSLVADGESVKQVAGRFGVSRSMVYDWLRMDPTGEREQRFQDARRASAEVHADRAGEVLEELDPLIVTAPMVQLANSRSNYYRWMAEVRDREAYGSKPSVAVNVSLGSLHLDALRQAGRVEVLQAQEVEMLPPADVIEELNG